jgi:hypothetical protein
VHFAVLTFDNVFVDSSVTRDDNKSQSWSGQGLYYVASGPAFIVERDGTVASADKLFGHQNGDVWGDGTNPVTITWDKVRLYGLSSPKGYYDVNNADGTGSVSFDKVWLVAHGKQQAGTTVENNNIVWAATFDDVGIFDDRGGTATSGYIPLFGSVVTVDHSGVRSTGANTGNAEEFDFDAAIAGDFDSAELYVYLTSNFSSNGGLFAPGLGAVGSQANNATNTNACTTYIVNLMDSAGTFGYDSLVSQVSYDAGYVSDDSILYQNHTAWALSSGAVTYSNPHVAVLGDGGTTSSANADDLVVMAFEARGISRDTAANWEISSGYYAADGWATIDNVYVISNLYSGFTNHAANFEGFNADRATRVDPFNDGTLMTPTTSTEQSLTSTHDSVSSDDILMGLDVVKLNNNNSENQYLVGVSLLSYTPAGTQSSVTGERVYSQNNNNGAQAAWPDLYYVSSILDDDNLASSYAFGSSLRISTEAATGDAANYNKVPVATNDAVRMQVRSQKVLNDNFFELNINYLATFKKSPLTGTNVNGVSGWDIGNSAGEPANAGNMDLHSRTFTLSSLADTLRSSSNGVCLIGRKEDDYQNFRR